jgi:hypothetical protein
MEFIKKIKESGLLTLATLLLCSLFGICDAGAMCADVVYPGDGGAVSVEGELSTVTGAEQEAIELFQRDVFDEVLRIRPHLASLVTIVGHAAQVRNATSMRVADYVIDTIDRKTKVVNLTAGSTLATGLPKASIIFEKNGIIARDQTLICTGVQGYKPDGTLPVAGDEEYGTQWLALLVVDKDQNGNPVVIPVNGEKATSGSFAGQMVIPANLTVNTSILIAGRAGGETQIQTDPYSGVPTDKEMFLQKFMGQVEMSDLFQRWSNKEVKWSFTDAEIEALFAMKQEMNAAYWFNPSNTKLRVPNRKTSKIENVWITQGIWAQAGQDFSFNGTIDQPGLTLLCKNSFTKVASSGDRKMLICGGDIIEGLENIPSTNQIRYIKEGERKAAYGLSVDLLISKFGVLYVAYDPTFDENGMSDKAFVLDAPMLVKWSLGQKTQTFDFRSSGQADADGRVFIDNSGLRLRNPKSHIRVSLA